MIETGARANLLVQAWKARENSYAPYSKFGVGAALLTASGDVFSGGNVENVSLGLTICAERAAAVAAVQAGKREFLALAVVSDTVDPLMPCGACCQFLAEFSPHLAIFSEGRGREFKEVSLDHLLPYPLNGILDQ